MRAAAIGPRSARAAQGHGLDRGMWRGERSYARLSLTPTIQGRARTAIAKVVRPRVLHRHQVTPGCQLWYVHRGAHEVCISRSTLTNTGEKSSNGLRPSGSVGASPPRWTGDGRALAAWLGLRGT